MRSAITRLLLIVLTSIAAVHVTDALLWFGTVGELPDEPEARTLIADALGTEVALVSTGVDGRFGWSGNSGIEWPYGENYTYGGYAIRPAERPYIMDAEDLDRVHRAGWDVWTGGSTFPVRASKNGLLLAYDAEFVLTRSPPRSRSLVLGVAALACAGAAAVLLGRRRPFFDSASTPCLVSAGALAFVGLVSPISVLTSGQSLRTPTWALFMVPVLAPGWVIPVLVMVGLLVRSAVGRFGDEAPVVATTSAGIDERSHS